MATVGPEPCTIQCPSCHSQIVTETTDVSTTCTHIWALALFICICPCFWIPYCTSCCRNTNHTCPNCRAFIGTYKRN